MSVGWKFRAADASGRLIEGVVRAGDARGAVDAVRRQTLVPVSVERDEAARTFTSRGAGRRDDEVAAAIRAVASLLAGGAALDRALEFSASSARHPEVAAALSAIRADVVAGSGFAQAVAERSPLFGALAPAMIRAGEESGRLDQSLASLADHLERARTLRSRLRSALLYPALMGVMSGVGLVVLLAFVVPRFVRMLGDAGASLPWSTRLLVSASDMITNWWWLLLGVLAAVWLGTREWLATPAGRTTLHRFRIESRLVGDLERLVWTSRFAQSLGVLLTSGSALLPSLRLARASVGNEAMRDGLSRVEHGVERGERLAERLAGVLPPLAVQLLAVGEESGTLGEMAQRVAQTCDEEVQRRLSALVALVEPLLIIAFGALVGFVALAMLQAIYSINASVL